MEKQNKESHEALPSLIKAITAHEVVGFDSLKENKDLNCEANTPHSSSTSVLLLSQGIEAPKPQRTHSISISMPPSPVGAHLHYTNRVLDNDTVLDIPKGEKKQAKFYSQPMPKGSARINGGNSSTNHKTYPAINNLQDKQFDSFKTWSGKLERQLSNLRGKHHETEQHPQIQQHSEFETVPVGRYFDALEGPELDTLRASEQILLPEDKKWPFLLRFPISSFGICLGLSSQAIMWKALSSSSSTSFLHVGPHINLVLWFISVALVLIVTLIYSLKIIFYFEAVRREYFHPIRVNFFFAPWIALLFLAHGVPPSVSQTLHASLWYVLMAPILCLELKIYGQWMSGGQRKLSKVANPSNHLSIVGNFVGALLGASMELKEGPIFFFAVGLAHYAVLFVTLYQRLPTSETLPKELHPVFFLFVAAPSVASMAWARIQGSFDYGSKIAYFIALFLYVSLAVRVNFFRGFRFSLAWWAYTFPMTGAATASIKYSNAVTTIVTKTFSLFLCIVATFAVTALLVTTVVHAFVLQDLFPNDIAIAISGRRPKASRRWYHRRSDSSDDRNLKHVDLDVEASITSSTSNNQ